MRCCCFCACAALAVPLPAPPAVSSSSLFLRSPSPTPLLLSTRSSSSPPPPLRRRPIPVPVHAHTSSSSSSSRSPSMAAARKPFSILFVCLGNICRSPAAEAVFRDAVRKRGLESLFLIDSAGTIGYHEGDPADPRMRSAAARRGVEVTSLSRPIRPSDFRDFDIILAMDKQNRDDLLSAYERWRFKEPLPEDAPNKVKLMCSYCKRHQETEVPDPYYGGPQGFEKVLDLLEDACEALLDSILADNNHVSAS